MATALASFAASVTFAGSCVFSGEIVVEQLRGDEPSPTVVGDSQSFDVALTFDRTVWDAITARARWTGSVLTFDDQVILTGRAPAVKFDESMPPGSTQQATMGFSPVGDIWAIPSADYVPPEKSTCPVTIAAHIFGSPKMYGNKATSLDVLLGASPAKMKTFRLFRGQSLQKSNKGSVQITGDISCVDDSALFANKPICYELPPFAGKRRDEIIRDIISVNGFGTVVDDTFVPLTVLCPVGKMVTKPLLLTNASLMPFLADFIAAENWFASFDEQGRLYIREVEVKADPDPPDWTLDESLGDFDFDSLIEQPPDQPPTRFIVSLSQPVKGTGPGGSSLTLTTRTIEEDQELYNPECVKVRPSGKTSYLLGDGSYRDLPAETMMTVSRKITETTTVDGQQTRLLTRTFLFYNPLGFDPNYNSDPPTASYDGAYGNKSFHRDEIESLVEVSEETFDTTRDLNGTILGTVQTTKGWFAPHRAAVYATDERKAILTKSYLTPPAYVYAGGTTRIQAAETYGVTVKVEKTYLYGTDGALSTVTERRTEFYSAESRCDLIETYTTPDSGPPTVDSNPEPPIITSPPPPAPPPPPTAPPPAPPPPSIPDPFHPVLTGPGAASGTAIGSFRRFVFRIDVKAPDDGPIGSATLAPRVCLAQPGENVPVYGTPPSGVSIMDESGQFVNTPTLNSNSLSGNCVGSITWQYDTNVVDRQRFLDAAIVFYLTVSVVIGGDTYYANNIIFNPFPADGLRGTSG